MVGAVKMHATATRPAGADTVPRCTLVPNRRLGMICHGSVQSATGECSQKMKLGGQEGGYGGRGVWGVSAWTEYMD